MDLWNTLYGDIEDAKSLILVIMEYRQLGRTGIQVSLLGQGCGGPSQLGQRTNVDQAGIDRLITLGLDAGINFFDTAEAYGNSETILGNALTRVQRDDYYLASKFTYRSSNAERKIISPKDLRRRLHQTLRCLKVECLDLYQIHGLQLEDVDSVMNDLVPELERQRQAGRIRFIGVTELWDHDGRHNTLMECVPSGQFDTAMIGYNLLNSCADDLLFEICRRENIGVIIMFAVRRAMSDLARRQQIFDRLVEEGSLEIDALDTPDPLAWLVSKEVSSVKEAGYRFAIDPDVVGTVLTGTSKEQHLTQNLSAITAGPLPKTLHSEIKSRYGHLTQPLGN